LALRNFFREISRQRTVVSVIIIAIAIVGFAIAWAMLSQIRRAFIVPEGYVGLLYHRGQFTETLRAGRHVRWGLNYTLEAVDFRKASLNVVGQEKFLPRTAWDSK
jgi:regulator of protease activity HflC (stomatin/prohibitin superfamily)